MPVSAPSNADSELGHVTSFANERIANVTQERLVNYCALWNSETPCEEARSHLLEDERPRGAEMGIPGPTSLPLARM